MKIHWSRLAAVCTVSVHTCRSVKQGSAEKVIFRLLGITSIFFCVLCTADFLQMGG